MSLAPYSFSLDELNRLAHPSQSQRITAAKEITEQQRLAEVILKKWSKSRLTKWIATTATGRIVLQHTHDRPDEFAERIETHEILQYIHRTQFSSHRNITLTVEFTTEAKYADNTLHTRPVAAVVLRFKRFAEPEERPRRARSRTPHRQDWHTVRQRS